ncbi:MAG: hypothetical protein ACLFRP_04710 [Puniceicoccaceae bacterium]
MWEERRGWVLREEDSGGAVNFAEAAPAPGFPGPPDGEIETRLAGWVRSGDRSGWRGTGCLGFADWCLGVSLPAEVGVPSAGLLAEDDRTAAAGASYPVYKVKIGVRPAAEERAWLEGLLARTPARVRFRPDGNRSLGWEETRRWLDWMEGRERIEFLEQPLPAGAEARIVREFGEERARRIALDESVAADGALRELVESGWPGWLVVKPALLGEPGRLLSLPAGARRRLVLSSVFETGIGFSHVLLLATLLGGGRAADGLGTRGFFGPDGLDGWSPSPSHRGRLTASFFGEIWNRVLERASGG